MMSKILDRLLRKKLNTFLSRAQSKITLGFDDSIPQGLNEKEKEMYLYCLRTAQIELYHALEDMKWKQVYDGRVPKHTTVTNGVVH